MANEEDKITREDFLAALRNTFGTPDGKLILKWLHASAATRKPAFVAARGNLDPLAAAFRDGRKSIVWEIETNLGAAATHGADKPKTRTRASARTKGG